MRTPPRLHRLLGPDGRCLDVAIDHGAFNEVSFLGGIEDMRRAVATVAAAAPDAVQLARGQAGLLQDLPGRAKPALVLRTDVTNVYGGEPPTRAFAELTEDAVLEAVRLDAACVVVNLLLWPADVELHRTCIANVARVRAACDRVGMPLMVEPIAMRPAGPGRGLVVDGDPARVVPLVRQAIELGADLIKADPTDRIEDWPRVVEVCAGRPLLVRGGGKAREEEVLARSVELLRLGASGLVYGRNVIQHPRPAAMVRALMAIVHENASAEQAVAISRAASEACG